MSVSAYDPVFHRLWVRLKRGDNSAKQLILDEYIRLVRMIARRYARRCRHLEFEDLLAEGVIGLFEAVDRYRPEIRCKFSTYAGYWIRQSIRRAIEKEERLVRLPAYLIDQVDCLNRSRDILAQNLQREPTDAELAAAVGLAEVRARAILKSSFHLPLDPFGDDSDYWADVQFLFDEEIAERPVEDGAVSGLYVQAAYRALAALKSSDQVVIARYYGLCGNEERSLAALAEVIGLSREGTRQRIIAAMRRYVAALIKNRLISPSP